MQWHFTLDPSPLLIMLLLLLHCIAATTVLIIAIGGWSLVVLIGLVISLLFHLLRDAMLVLANSCIALRIEEDNVILITRTGIYQEGKLLRHSVVMPYLVIFNVAITGKYLARSVVIMPDSMDKISFRRLRVALRWGDLPLK